MKKNKGFTPTPCRFDSDKSSQLINDASLSLGRKKNNKVWGFTLLELLVVIAIIGLVATITLTMIYLSKNRAKKARIVSDLDQVRKAAELFYNSNEYSYNHLRSAPDILTLTNDVADQGGSLMVVPSGDSYVAYSVYPGAEAGHFWCTDSQGNSKDISGTPRDNCDNSILPIPPNPPKKTPFKSIGPLPRQYFYIK